MSTTPTSTPQPISGTVSAEVGAGETITLQVTRPDGTAATPYTMTTVDGSVPGTGSFSGTFTDTVTDQNTGNYTANFTIGTDAQYLGDSITGTFTIPAPLIARQMTATIGNSATISG